MGSIYSDKSEPQKKKRKKKQDFLTEVFNGWF